MSLRFIKIRELQAILGPGLLYAGAAVGVSHLVQSTRAGAEFGYQLLLVVVIINLIKYPIFDVGPRYAAATGETLLDGYKRLGSLAVWTYVLVSISTMFVVMAAISTVTAGLYANLFSASLEVPFIAILLLAACAVILGVGHYRTLDRLMKLIIILLTISTIVAVVVGFFNPIQKSEEWKVSFEWSDRTHLLFLVALIGWMPAPVDLTIWHSVWTVSKNRSRSSRISLKSAILDFRIGYWGTMGIAICFLILGAMLMYGTEDSPAGDGLTFAGQIIRMYTMNLGDWAYPIISIAAFTTMFSTLLTCLDAFPRTLRKSTKLLLKSFEDRRHHSSLYWFWIFLTVFGTAIVLLNLHTNMKQLVDMATTISFTVAPILAGINYIVMRRFVPAEYQPTKQMRQLNVAAIVALSLFSLWFVIYRFELTSYL